MGDPPSPEAGETDRSNFTISLSAVLTLPSRARGASTEARVSAMQPRHHHEQALISCVKSTGLKLSAAGQTALDSRMKIHRWRLTGSTGKRACRVTTDTPAHIRLYF
jgi:hypothetical protein